MKSIFVNNDEIVIISGLPRSGTSLMMQMLDMAGMDILSDGVRGPDIDNPKGYYEFERVKDLRHGDQTFLEEAKGKAVKIISYLLVYLPMSYSYKVIFMTRRMEEILLSQSKMLSTGGGITKEIDDEVMKKVFRKHLNNVKAWLRNRVNFHVLYVSYNELLEEPENCIERINDFLNANLDKTRLKDVIDPRLYRNQSG